MLHTVVIHPPAFQASPASGLAVFSTHEANAIQTKHRSDCFRGRKGASNPEIIEIILNKCTIYAHGIIENYLYWQDRTLFSAEKFIKPALMS